MLHLHAFIANTKSEKKYRKYYIIIKNSTFTIDWGGDIVGQHSRIQSIGTEVIGGPLSTQDFEFWSKEVFKYPMY